MKLKTSALKSSSGGFYVACDVPIFLVYSFILEAAKISGPKFHKMHENRQKRDGKKYHITLISPGEMKALSDVKIPSTFEFGFRGLGRAFDRDAEAIFVVASSSQAAQLRSDYGLPKRDFHVTLGFDPTDIHDRHKGIRSLVGKSEYDEAI